MTYPYLIPPPSSVPGPFKATAPPPVNGPGVVTPHVARWHIVQPGETLWKIAQHYYNKPSEWVRIFNANRAGAQLPDGTFGVLDTSNVYGTERLLIP